MLLLLLLLFIPLYAQQIDEKETQSHIHKTIMELIREKVAGDDYKPESSGQPLGPVVVKTTPKEAETQDEKKHKKDNHCTCPLCTLFCCWRKR
jgi:hypothetical protein